MEIDEDLLRCVRREFDEQPVLRLTLPQAIRLFGTTREKCEAALQALVEAKFLVCAGDKFHRSR